LKVKRVLLIRLDLQEGSLIEGLEEQDLASRVFDEI